MPRYSERVPQEYRVVGALDTETVNVHELERSLPVCWQTGYNHGSTLAETDLDSLDLRVHRSHESLSSALAQIVRDGVKMNYCPVIMVHNLSYDLHFLMSWITAAWEAEYEISCCFKSSIKPLNVKVSKGGMDRLVIWDTLTFTGMSLSKMGDMCGCEKTREWDYSRTRHIDTPLTAEEEHYALNDIRVMFAYLKYWLSLNPDVDERLLGTTVLTKTSVVRYKCRQHARELSFTNSRGKKTNTYQSFMCICKRQLPANESQYNLMIRSTSAGWTFTASEAAGVAWEHVRKYDAKSMHPSHMLSHYYPHDFETVKKPEHMEFVYSCVAETALDTVLKRWMRPFDFAFHARVRFKGLRMKEGSVFARDGVALHGSGLFADYETLDLQFADDESSNMEFNAINGSGYANVAAGARYEFGKLVSADELTITLNELNAWVHEQVYDYDSREVLEMSATAVFRKPPDYVSQSVAYMLERKSFVKDLLKGSYEQRPDWMPEKAYQAITCAPDGADANAYYMQVKADLNSLYGMFATNEAKQSVVWEYGNFVYDGKRGFDNLPEKPKAWYAFGLRVAAFSRLQQCAAMMLLDAAGCVERFVNGDTDSFAFECTCEDSDVMEALAPLHRAIAASMSFVTSRAKIRADLLEGLGAYEVDCTPDVYCAVANKRYAYTDHCNTVIHVASAGVPVKSVRAALEHELQYEEFDAATIRALGYNVTYVGSLSGFKAQSKPEWCERLVESVTVTDYKGAPYTYAAGETVGTYLRETDKILGYGYESDYLKCCGNAKVAPWPMHRYELTGNGNVKEY